MKNALQIILKDQSLIEIEVMVKSTSDTFLKVHELQEGIAPLFLEINHQQVNTLLELSKVSPFVLLYFDETLNFIGASYSLNGFKNQFGISIQAKKLLVLSFPIVFKLEEVVSLTIIS